MRWRIKGEHLPPCLGLVGQKVSFDTAEDRRSGKIAVNNIETA
jgi:hypothetical protein